MTVLPEEMINPKRSVCLAAIAVPETIVFSTHPSATVYFQGYAPSSHDIYSGYHCHLCNDQCGLLFGLDPCRDHFFPSSGISEYNFLWSVPCTWLCFEIPVVHWVYVQVPQWKVSFPNDEHCLNYYLLSFDFTWDETEIRNLVVLGKSCTWNVFCPLSMHYLQLILHYYVFLLIHCFTCLTHLPGLYWESSWQNPNYFHCCLSCSFLHGGSQQWLPHRFTVSCTISSPLLSTM